MRQMTKAERCSHVSSYVVRSVNTAYGVHRDAYRHPDKSG